MSYDEHLAERIRQLVSAQRGVTEKKMFGGLAFLIGGHMSIAASRQRSRNGGDAGPPDGYGWLARGQRRREHQATGGKMGRSEHLPCLVAAVQALTPPWPVLPLAFAPPVADSHPPVRSVPAYGPRD